MSADHLRSRPFHALILICLAALLAHPDEAQARRGKHHEKPAKAQHHVARQKSRSHASRAPDTAESHETRIPPTPPPVPSPALEGDERIMALRGWLKQRSVERGETSPGQYDLDTLFGDSTHTQDTYAYNRNDSLRREKRLDLSLPPLPPIHDTTQEENRPGGGVLRIGRDADGRVYHRYVFRDSDTEATPQPSPNKDIDDILIRGRRSNRYTSPTLPSDEPIELNNHPVRSGLRHSHKSKKGKPTAATRITASKVVSSPKKTGKHKKR